MDRFIVIADHFGAILKQYLKSNMDRFIDSASANYQDYVPNLKSNMDRFIGYSIIAYVIK